MRAGFSWLSTFCATSVPDVKIGANLDCTCATGSVNGARPTGYQKTKPGAMARCASVLNRFRESCLLGWAFGPRNVMKNGGAGAFACQRLIEPAVGRRKRLPHQPERLIPLDRRVRGGCKTVSSMPSTSIVTMGLLPFSLHIVKFRLQGDNSGEFLGPEGNGSRRGGNETGFPQ